MFFKRLLNQVSRLPHIGARRAGRSILLAGVVGVIAGLGAVVFHLMCLFVTHFTVGNLANYEQGRFSHERGWTEMVNGEPAHEGARPTFAQMEEEEPLENMKLWLLILIPTVGGVVSGYIVYKFAPEAEGHGTDAAIRAYHREGGRIRSRVPIVKMIASAITLGTGGSGGREGPIAQIGAGFGSFLGTKLGLNDSERRVLLAAGLGAGIGAIFHAPLAGAIFAIEVLYRDTDFESEALIPAFIATTVAFSIFSVTMGTTSMAPLFAIETQLTYSKPLRLLLPLAVLAVTMSFASMAYVKCFYGITALFKKMKRVPPWVRTGIGGCLTGVFAVCVFLLLPDPVDKRDSLSVLSFGYDYLQKILNPSSVNDYAILVLLIVGLGKILTTSLTIGSGGSGGVFGPSMVIGASLGALVGLLFHRIMPGVVGEKEIVIFPILGMASFFAAAANTPVSTLIMVSELTAGYVLLLPSMWVCALAYLFKGKWTIYRDQVHNRQASPAHRGEFIIDVMKDLKVDSVLADTHRKFSSVPPDMSLKEIGRLFTSTVQVCFPVVSSEGKYMGLISTQDIRQFLYDQHMGELAVAHDVLTSVAPLTLQTDLPSAITRFAMERFEELPVVDEAEPEKVVGMLRRFDVISTYNRRLLEVRKSPEPPQ